MGTIDREIIERVVMEVLQRLGSREEGEPILGKPGLLIVCDSTFEKKALEAITMSLQDKWNIYQADTDSAEKISITTDIKRILFLNVGQDFIVRGALGLTDTNANQLLADVLLRGLPVTLVPCSSLKWLLHPEAGEAVLPETAMRYRRYIRERAEALASFGASIGTITDLLLLEEGVSVQAAEEPASTKEEAVFQGKLLTQREVQQVSAPVLLVSRSTVITPLARDTARDKGIVLRMEEQ
jgi:hypothetical protein